MSSAFFSDSALDRQLPHVAIAEPADESGRVVADDQIVGGAAIVVGLALGAFARIDQLRGELVDRHGPPRLGGGSAASALAALRRLRGFFFGTCLHDQRVAPRASRRRSERLP